MIRVCWIQEDLRLADNQALTAAAADGSVIIPIYIWDGGEAKPSAGAASRWWLHHSLLDLSKELRTQGSRLIVRKGDPPTVLARLLTETGAKEVHWTRGYGPASIALHGQARKVIEGRKVAAVEHQGSLLLTPQQIRNAAGQPYRIFTRFWDQCTGKLLGSPPKPLPPPSKLQPPKNWPASLAIEELELLPKLNWTAEMARAWVPGERGAQAELVTFIESRLRVYADMRDIPSVDGTSRLSPHLHFGELSPRQVWDAVKRTTQQTRSEKVRRSADAFLRELGWREFAHHLLYHFPHSASEPVRPEFRRLPWSRNAPALRAWQRGQTGYPIIDAGMRQLWRVGWMHNRVRMIVASFLVKDLSIPWQDGAQWFMDTLVDADLANNTLNWQWVAGCGADAAPFFRIFNPVLQSKKFDPQGSYIRRFVPELAALPQKWIHAPWQAPREVVRQAAIRLGADYPRPIVDHEQARERALAAFASIARSSAPR